MVGRKYSDSPSKFVINFENVCILTDVGIKLNRWKVTLTVQYKRKTFLFSKRKNLFFFFCLSVTHYAAYNSNNSYIYSMDDTVPVLYLITKTIVRAYAILHSTEIYLISSFRSFCFYFKDNEFKTFGHNWIEFSYLFLICPFFFLYVTYGMQTILRDFT